MWGPGGLRERRWEGAATMRRRRVLLTVLVLTVVVATTLALTQAGHTPAPTSAPAVTTTTSAPGLTFTGELVPPPGRPRPTTTAPTVKVKGNKLVNSAGATVRLLGVDRSGTEYACIQGWGIFDGPSDAASVAAMKAWHIDAVRV